MLKAGGEGFNLQPRCDSGYFAGLPSNDRREMHRRKQVLFNLRQNGIGPDLTLNIKGLVGVCREHQRGRSDESRRQQFEDGSHSALRDSGRRP